MIDEMDEIWALYADDGAQALDAMETALAGLDADAGNADHVSALFRAVHTFKGNSRVLGLSTVESRAHLAEDLIGLVRDAGVAWDPEIRVLMLETADVLRSMLEQTALAKADVAPEPTEGLARRLRDKIARCQGAADDAGDLPGDQPTLPDIAQDPPPADDTQGGATPDDPEAEAADDPMVEAVTPTPARLADDPAYRAIFDGMVDDMLARLDSALARGEPEAAQRLADDLAHAAARLGLDDWVAALALPPGPVDHPAACALRDRLRALADPGMAPTPQADIPAPEADPPLPDPDRPAAAAATLDPAFLERLGEIAVGQSMVSGNLQDMLSIDLVQDLGAVLRGHEGLPPALLADVAAIAEAMMQRVQTAATMAEQLSAHMAELQQQAADMRLRPASSVLRALAERIAAAPAAHEGGVTFAGDDGGLALDHAVLDDTAQLLDATILPRLQAATTTARGITLRLYRAGDRLGLEIEDTGADPSHPLPATVQDLLDRIGADAQALALAGGGRIDMMTLPLPQVVLEGMAVRAGAMRWVLPLDCIRSLVQPPPGAILTVSAQRGLPMLRLSKDEIVPVYALPGDRPDLSVPGRVFAVLQRMQQSVAVPVDELIGQQLVLVRPMRGLLSGMRHVSGMALLAGGDVGLVLAHTAIGGGAEPSVRRIGRAA